MMLGRILSLLGIKGKQASPTVANRASGPLNKTGDGCVIENGILISYEVKSEICVIPEGVTELKNFAINYGRDKIEEVVLPSTLRYIRQHNFSSCKNLKRINLPEGLMEIEERSFEYCDALQEITLPNSLRTIGPKAFYACKSLRCVNFGNGIQKIGEEAFAFCNGLEKLSFPGSLRLIEKKAFTSSDSLESVVFHEGNLEIGEGAFQHSNKLTQVQFAPGLKAIGDDAFCYCGIQRVELPKGIVRIGNRVFADCGELSSVRMADIPQHLGNYLFTNCENIQHWDVPAELLKPEFKVRNGVLEETICVVDLEEIVIPEGVTEIGSKGIHRGAKRIAFPASLRKIHNHAFEYGEVEKVIFHEGLEEIGEYAFSHCFHLQEIRLPDTVHTLGMSAFSDCTKLQSVRLSCGLREIPSWTFSACRSLEEIVIPAGVTEIDSWAFCRCKNLRKVVLPEGLETIELAVFEDCKSLETVKLPPGVTYISLSAFKGCAALKELVLPDGLEKINESAFSGCCSLTEMIIPHGITELKSGLFSGCTGLRRVVIPASVQMISRYTFSGCKNLEDVVCEKPERFEAALLETPYWKRTYPHRHGQKRLPLGLVGTRSGKTLNALGYTLFDPARDYQIFMPGEDGVVKVCSYVSEDGPDEDGFGREVYYDWWLLDEELNPIPDVPMWHEYSTNDLRCHEKEWKALREKAAAHLRGHGETV